MASLLTEDGTITANAEVDTHGGGFALLHQDYLPLIRFRALTFIVAVSLVFDTTI
jgi:hypothetical protein